MPEQDIIEALEKGSWPLFVREMKRKSEAAPKLECKDSSEGIARKLKSVGEAE